jgi:hypothetical protein
MTVRVNEIRAYDDGTVGHGVTHKVTFLRLSADGTVQGTLEMTLAMPQLHEALIPGHDYVLTLQPAKGRGSRRPARSDVTSG